MKKILASFILFLSSVAFAQYTPTPNIGLQIPSNGSNNWNLPLNYNFNRLDLLLSGNLALPGLSITGNEVVSGSITAGSFIGVGGGTFPTISGSPTNPQCAYWVTSTTLGGQSCSVASGFPFTLGSTTITASGSIPAVTGLSVNGVILNSSGSSSLFLNQAGGYTSAASSGVSDLNTLTGSLTIAAGSNITVTPSGGNTLTIASTGGGGLSTSANLYSANSQVLADSIVTSTAFGYYAFGDSITCFQGATAANKGYASVIAQDYGIVAAGGVLSTNFCHSGDGAADQTWHIFTNYNPGDSGDPIVTTAIGTNNVGTPGVEYNRVLLAGNSWAAISSSNKVSPVGGTLTGTHTTDTTFSNANGVTCTSGPCTWTITGYVGTPNQFYLWYKMVASGGNVTVTVDATPVTDSITGSTTISTSWVTAPGFQTSTVGLARFPATNSGTSSSHTIVVTFQTGATILPLGFPPIQRYRGMNHPRVMMAGIPPEQNNANSTNVAVINSANLAASKLLVGDGLDVPFVDTNTIDPVLDMAGSALQNCPASSNPGLHPNNCGHLHIAQKFEAQINAAIPAASPNISGPLSVTSPAATNIAGFNNLPPHSAFDTLIQGIQQCDSTFCGIKQYHSTRGFGYGPFTLNEVGIGFLTTGSPASESDFTWPIWFTFNNTTDLGTVHAVNGTYSGVLTSGTDFVLPVQAGYSAGGSSGHMGYDSTTKNIRTDAQGVDMFLGIFPSGSPPSSGNCSSFLQVGGGTWELHDSGAPCGLATNLIGGALGSIPYQTAANTTAFVASPTTNLHIFFLGWGAGGGLTTPSSFDLTNMFSLSGSMTVGGGGIIVTGASSSTMNNLVKYGNTSGNTTDSGKSISSVMHSDDWVIQSTLFATTTTVGTVFYEPALGSFNFVQARLEGTISCAVAPIITILDLGTSPSTAYGSATVLYSLTTGTTDGVYNTSSAGNISVAAGHYLGLGFSVGTCVTAPTFDVSVAIQ